MRSGSRAARWRRALPLLLCALTAALFASPAPAGADVFGPISLISGGMLGGGEPQQAEYAHDPAISGDGRYIAFDGSFGGVTGVWRRDLTSGEIQQVAGGDAELPSISEDGRYISFTTNEGASLAEITGGKLDAHPKQEAVNVYVRDMGVPIPASGQCESPTPCPFTVVSAPSGSTKPLTYAGTTTTTGSVAVGRSAIDAKGNEVAFVTTAVSDLVKTEKDKLAEAKGEPPPPETPALQVAVRYLETDTTKLVSGRYEPATGRTTEAPVSATVGTEQYGAVYPGEGISFTPPPAYGRYGKKPPPGASLSADGSTVVWMGDDIGEQAPSLSEESRHPHYTEPLWRRIATGSETPTERVTGGSDPGNPACTASGEGVLPEKPSLSDPCQGPFVTPEGVTPSGILAGGTEADFVPRLSADGYTVAFASRAPLLVSLNEYFGDFGQPTDLYVANMHAGLTRAQALTQLTQIESHETAGAAEIVDFGLSPNGEQVAFATMRTQFLLGSPSYISAPAAEPGMEELFDADLHNHTLTRVTRGYGGGASEHPHPSHSVGVDPYQPGDGALSPSFSADGDILAFASTASNLVWGDGNTPSVKEESGTLDGSDAFAVERIGFSAMPTPQLISQAPAGPPFAPVWSLGVSALSRPDGSVLLYVEVPAGGELHAAAQSEIPIRTAGRSRSARRVCHASGPRRRHAGRTYHAIVRRGLPRATVAVRTVAAGTVSTQSGSGELLTLVLTLAKPYLALASHQGGLAATVHLLFTATAGGPALRQSVPVSFLHTAHAAPRSGRAARGSRRR